MPISRKPKASQLTDHLGYWLRLVSNSVSHAFSLKLEATGVTVAEWVILRELYEKLEGTAPSDVAAATGLTRGAISKLISRLIDKGLVLRRESPGDRRYQEVELTARARSLVPQLAALADENDREFFSGLSASEKNQLKGLLEKIADQQQIKTVPID